jgi:hypothetical protein
VPSLAHPGGNATGSPLRPGAGGKRLCRSCVSWCRRPLQWRR